MVTFSFSASAGRSSKVVENQSIAAKLEALHVRSVANTVANTHTNIKTFDLPTASTKPWKDQILWESAYEDLNKSIPNFRNALRGRAGAAGLQACPSGQCRSHL
jgi:hypothetical protein